MENNYKYPIIADNYYELLGFKPFCIINSEDINYAYQERYKYWKSFINSKNMGDKAAAFEELMKARKTLLHSEERKRYDILLKKRSYSQLQNMVALALKLIFENGIKFGITKENIKNIFIESLK